MDDLPYGEESTTGRNLSRGLRLVIPRPDTVLPRRVAGRPWCPECGMSEGHHLEGCSQPAWVVDDSRPIRG